MKNFYLSALLLWSCSNLCFAQSNYKPGYVVNLKGDTSRGFIDYREWNQSPKSIKFKATLNDSKVSNLSPGEISDFNITDLDEYQLYNGKITTDPDNTRMARERDTSYKIASVFLKVIQRGKNVTLYSYTDEIKLRFFLKRSGESVPHEMIYRIYNGSQGQTEENGYQKELFALATKYNILDDRLIAFFSKMNYNEDDILFVVSKINGTDGKTVHKINGVNGGKEIEFFAGAGVNITSISPNSISSYAQAGGKNYTSVLPRVAAGINIYPSPNTRKIYFGIELGYGLNQYKSVYLNKVSPYNTIDYSFNQNAASLTVQINYNIYNGDDFKFFVGAGGLASFFGYSNKVFKSVDPNSYVPNEPAFTFETFNTTFMLRTGVRIARKWEIYGNYIVKQDLSNDNYFTLSNSTIQLGATYNF